MLLPLEVGFVDRASGLWVPGAVQLGTERDLLRWTQWRYRPGDEDQMWDWWGIFVECAASGGRYECYAAVTDDRLEGLAVLDLQQKNTAGGPAITIDYLSTNPENRHRERGMKFVGLALMATAVIRSQEHGAEGRIWLESLPGAAAFYENLGMSKQAFRSNEGNLVYVLERKPAQQLLEQMRVKSILKL